MIVHPEPPPGKSGVADDAYSDPRLDAVIDFFIAHDNRDARKGVEATRRLRSLGYSIALVPLRPSGGGR